jgi:hypothetical protein
MIKIFDSNLNFLGFLDRFNSFQCSLKYADAGSFSIKAILTKETVYYLKEGNFIQFEDFAGMIDSIQMNDSAGDVPTITASGYDLTGLLATRIIWTDEYYNGNSEEFLRKIVSDNAINPADSRRKIPCLALGELSGLPQTTERNTKHETLLEECVKVCKVADYGFSIDLDAKNKQMNFKIYEGTDRTAGQPQQVIIGKSYDNVMVQDYTYSSKDEITTCLVIADEGSVSIGEEAAGLKRKETFLKSSTKQEELTTEQFQNVLRSEGNEQLNNTIQCFDIDIFNTSLSIGDKITVKDKDWNILFHTRVEEKQTTLESGIKTTSFLLGKDIKMEVKN